MSELAADKIWVRVNGQKRELPPGMSLSHLLKELGLKPQGVVLELNRRIVDRGQYDLTLLSNEDSLEIVHFVGGGSL